MWSAVVTSAAAGLLQPALGLGEVVLPLPREPPEPPEPPPPLVAPPWPPPPSALPPAAASRGAPLMPRCRARAALRPLVTSPPYCPCRSCSGGVAPPLVTPLVPTAPPALPESGVLSDEQADACSASAARRRGEWNFFIIGGLLVRHLRAARPAELARHARPQRIKKWWSRRDRDQPKSPNNFHGSCCGLSLQQCRMKSVP